MKNALFFLACVVAIFLCFPPQLKADIIDAPHNQSSGVHCTGCHSYSLWWQYSPLETASPTYKAQIDSICSHCHYAGSQMVAGCGHSSAAMEEIHNPLLGTWQTNCLDCHDPHFQAQLTWRQQYENDLYLVVGTIGAAVSFSYADGQTTFAYATSSASPNWTDWTTWPRKTSPSGNRGLILVVDTMEQKNTYQVVAADSSTVTIKGILESLDENKTFGLIYGQFIKSTIQFPGAIGRTVLFFDPKRTENGFVDSQTPPRGICQVCHTDPNIRYWTADGTNTSHNAGTLCTNCHIPSRGFKPQSPFAGHIVTNTGGCDACHGPLDTLAAIEALHVAANGPDSCETCHASTRPEVVAATASGSATCTDCHAEQTVHQATFYYTDQIDVPLIMTDTKGVRTWQKERLPFGETFPQ